MKLGDLIMFAWPEGWSKVGDPLCWEEARLGIIIDVLAAQPDDALGNELLVIHEGERWSVPESWCKLVKVYE